MNDTLLNEARLAAIAENFLMEHYQMPLDIPIERNNRLRSTHGRFIIKNNQAYKIELAGYVLDYGTKDVIIGVLKHECIHYVLYKQKIAHRDGDYPFENELKKHAAPKTGTVVIGKYYKYSCVACGRISVTNKRKVTDQPGQYRTSCCNAKLSIIGEEIFDGTETP